VFDQTHVTPEALNWPYKGAGTKDDPFVVEYMDHDSRNPMLFPDWKKWLITILVAFVSPTNIYIYIYISLQLSLLFTHGSMTPKTSH
jgi:hypothetical protein